MLDGSLDSGPQTSAPIPPLVVSVRREGACTTVIEVSGELDVATAPTLRTHLERLGVRGHLDRIVYLLSDLRFMDSTGLHCILTAVDGHGIDTIGIREPSPQVRRLLELVGLDSLIEHAAPR